MTKNRQTTTNIMKRQRTSVQTKYRPVPLKQPIFSAFKAWELSVLSVHCQVGMNFGNLRSLANYYKYQE